MSSLSAASDLVRTSASSDQSSPGSAVNEGPSATFSDAETSAPSSSQAGTQVNSASDGLPPIQLQPGQPDQRQTHDSAGSANVTSTFATMTTNPQGATASAPRLATIRRSGQPLNAPTPAGALATIQTTQQGNTTNAGPIATGTVTPSGTQSETTSTCFDELIKQLRSWKSADTPLTIKVTHALLNEQPMTTTSGPFPGMAGRSEQKPFLEALAIELSKLPKELPGIEFPRLINLEMPDGIKLNSGQPPTVEWPGASTAEAHQANNESYAKLATTLANHYLSVNKYGTLNYNYPPPPAGDKFLHEKIINPGSYLALAGKAKLAVDELLRGKIPKSQRSSTDSSNFTNSLHLYSAQLALLYGLNLPPQTTNQDHDTEQYKTYADNVVKARITDNLEDHPQAADLDQDDAANLKKELTTGIRSLYQEHLFSETALKQEGKLAITLNIDCQQTLLNANTTSKPMASTNDIKAQLKKELTPALALLLEAINIESSIKSFEASAEVATESRQLVFQVALQRATCKEHYASDDGAGQQYNWFQRLKAPSDPSRRADQWLKNEHQNIAQHCQDIWKELISNRQTTLKQLLNNERPDDTDEKQHQNWIHQVKTQIAAIEKIKNKVSFAIDSQFDEHPPQIAGTNSTEVTDPAAGTIANTTSQNTNPIDDQTNNSSLPVAPQNLLSSQ